MNIQLAVTAEELQAEISPIQRFVKGVRHFDAIHLRLKGYSVSPNTYVPLDGE